MGCLVGIEVDFLNGKLGDVENIYVEIDLDFGFYGELEIISEVGRWKQKDTKLRNRFHGKCHLRDQITARGSLKG